MCWIWQFLTPLNLQGSQTIWVAQLGLLGFLPLLTYKVLKRQPLPFGYTQRFLPLLTYKVLKPGSLSEHPYPGFLPLLTYKVLKRKENI